LYFTIAAIDSSLGILPASESLFTRQLLSE
jgi:hypothetical protein